MNLPNFNSSWSLGEATYEAIRKDLAKLNPSMIVEFGSGASTLSLEQDFPETTVFSIDHAPEWYDETRSKIRKATTELALRPLKVQWHGGSPYQTYEVGSFPATVDAVLIDGPPYTTRRGAKRAFTRSLAK